MTLEGFQMLLRVKRLLFHNPRYAFARTPQSGRVLNPLSDALRVLRLSPLSFSGRPLFATGLIGNYSFVPSLMKAATPSVPSSNGKKSRIFIVDDHPLIRDGMTQLLNHEPDMAVCGSTDNARDAIDHIRGLEPDAVLVDISLAGTNGIELIKNMRAQFATLPVLVISMHDESLYALRSLRAGAQGYIMKREPSERIIGAIRQVLNNGIYLSETLGQQLIFKLVRSGDSENSASPIDRLTDRELEVLLLLGRGHGTRQIAEELSLSPKTVETHRMHLKEKLGCATAGELTKFAADWVECQTEATAGTGA